MIAQSPTVFLVDDDPSVLRALTRLLDSEGFKTCPFATPQSFLDHHDPDLLGCIILDVAMPDFTGLELQSRLGASGSGAQPIIFISGESDIPTSVSAMREGASDFLTKPVDAPVLLAAVRTAIERSRGSLKSRQERQSLEALFAKLTPREMEVFARVVAGRLNKQIAGDLGIVEKTVKVHRASVMQKMEVRTLADLVHVADRMGFAETH